MDPYNNSLEHIKEELNLLDLRLKVAVYLFKDPSASEDQKDLAGIVISDQEIQGILRNTNHIKEDSSVGKSKRKKDQNTKLKNQQEKNSHRSTK